MEGGKGEFDEVFGLIGLRHVDFSVTGIVTPILLFLSDKTTCYRRNVLSEKLPKFLPKFGQSSF